MHGIRPNLNGTQFSGVKFNNCYHNYSEKNILLEINISSHENQKCFCMSLFLSHLSILKTVVVVQAFL